MQGVRAGGAGLPEWVPTAARHYVQHTEAGLPIRQLARRAGCHASTVMRQIRKIEARRDDPLVDAALRRLVGHDGAGLPARLDPEAEAVLRRLCEPGAVLAVAEGMEKAVVVREDAEGARERTAVLDAALAQAMALKDWIACRKGGRVAQYAITGAGRAALGTGGGGFAEAPARFEGAEPAPRAPRYGPADSPLQALARRRDAEGKPFLAPALVRAGERLREDFEIAQLGPAVTQDWDRFLTAGAEAGAAEGDAPARGPAAARRRVQAALAELGPGLGDVALRCCCYLEGLESAERRMGWSARSGKIVLRIALQRLKRHYDATLGPGGPLIG
jgi:DNA-directed RNA polymerase specialized sigma24 family protein